MKFYMSINDLIGWIIILGGGSSIICNNMDNCISYRKIS